MVVRSVFPEHLAEKLYAHMSCQNIMDDANLPSLLSASMMGYVNPRDEVYMNTRLFALSEANPYWAFGNVFNAIGGPHTGPTKAWPLASIVRILTSNDMSGDEQRDELKSILSTTGGLGKLAAGTAHFYISWSLIPHRSHT